MALVDKIMAHEDGSLSAADTLDLFAELVSSGQAWTLQGAYGRQARALIDNYLITEAGEITDTARNLLAYEEEDDVDEDDPAYV